MNFEFFLLLMMNSVIIHTLRQRSKLNLLKSEGQGQDNEKNTKGKCSELQIFIMLLSVTFAFLILTTPMYVLIFYVNFYHGNTPYYYAGYYLFYNIAEKTFYTNNGIKFLCVMSGQKFRNDLMNLFRCSRFKRNKNSESNAFSVQTSTSSINDDNTNS